MRFIDEGAALTIEVLTYKEDELVYEFNGKFRDAVGFTTMIAECDGLVEAYSKNENFNTDFYLKIITSRGPNLYSFKGKVKSTVIEHGQMLAIINQTSDVKRSTRRTYPRLEVNIAVTIRSRANLPLLQGRAIDISAEGMCVLTNDLIPSDDNEFVLEFLLNKTDRFSLPSKFMRRGDSPQLAQFKNDYGFEFDYSEDTTEKSRLITSLFMHKMNGLP